MNPLSRLRALACSVVLVLVGLEGQHEASGIVGDVSIGGSSFPAGALLWPNQVARVGPALTAWAQASCAGIPLRAWLGAYLAFGILVLGGGSLLLVGVSKRWNLRVVPYVIALGAIGVVQLLLASAAVIRLPSGSAATPCQAADQTGLLAGALFLVSLLMGTLVAVIAVRVVWVLLSSPAAKVGARRTFQALALQRFGAGIVVLLAVLFLLPGAPVLEQGIDVERSWVIDGSLRSTFTGVLALVAFVVLAAAIRYLAGVQVAPFAIDPAGGDPSAAALLASEDLPPKVAAYFAGPGASGWAWWPHWFGAAWQTLLRSWRWFAAVAVLAVVLAVLDATPLVDVTWSTALWIGVVLLAVPVASAALALVPTPAVFDVYGHAVRRRALQIGRVLTVAIPVVLLVSLCRALVGPMLLLPDKRWWSVVAFVLAGASALAVVWVWFSAPPPDVMDAADVPAAQQGASLNPQVIGAQDATGGTAGVPGTAASFVPAALLTVVVAIPLLLWPAHISRWLGVAATIGVCLLGVVLAYSTLRIVSQLVDPPHVFRVMKMRRTPVISLVVLIAVCATFVAAPTGLHDARKPAAAAADERPELDAAFDTWLGRTQSSGNEPCAIQSGGVRIQPMLLIAAEGGGIRATWWTVKAMSALVDTPCGRTAMFLASGVSGGAVGLGIMATAPDPVGAVEAIAGQDALAAGTGGMLSRDLVAGAFGVEVRAVDGPDGDPFPDRAALMEQAWERRSAAYAGPFPGDGAVPWHTVFNGTSVIKQCRVLIADVVLTTSAAGQCTADGNGVPGAYDLFRAEPCLVGMHTTTASLMAARFPYVTPSALVRGCGGDAVTDQVVDGGYAENTGIDTLNSVVDQLGPRLRQANAAALAGGGVPTVIVPVVVFLHNTVVASTDGSASPPAAKPTPEIVVPPLNLGDQSQLAHTTTLLQHAEQAAGQWAPADVPADVSQAVDAVLPELALTIAPQQAPQMALPLGWALSEGTEQSLDDALAAYLTCAPLDAANCAPSRDVQQLLANWSTKR